MNINQLITILILSDIHLGHNKNPTENIIYNLKNFFTIYREKLINVNIIFIPGDLFHRLLTMASKDAKLIIEYLIAIFKYCKQNDITLRILEGTPSHDLTQPEILTSISKLVDFDYQYINTLKLEYLEKYNLTVLYIPDEIYPNDILEKKILELLRENNLTRVDFIIMHGGFKYQLNIELESNKDEEFYSNLVNYYCISGHYHTHSTYKNIIVPGSFDRLAQSEEEDKGGILIHIHPDRPKYFEFLKNPNAMLFKTYKVSSIDSFLKLKHQLPKLPNNSKVRIIHTIPLETDVVKQLRREFPNISIELKSDIKKKEITKTEVQEISGFEINENNIKSLLMNRLKNYELEESNLEKLFSEVLE